MIKKILSAFRFFIFVIITSSLYFSALAFADTIAPIPNEKEKLSFKTEDNLTISAWYQLPESKVEKNPAIILIHQGRSSKDEWVALPLWDMLLKQGYALLAYDIRQHGESSKDQGSLRDLFNNSSRSPLDLKAAIKFLQSDERVDGQRIGIIGASIGANLACVAASSNNYGIKSVVSISAKTAAAQSLSGLDSDIKPRNIFLIASEKEQGGRRKQWAEELFSRATGERRVEIASGSKHGSFILRENPELNDQIIEWFKLTL
jgi:dienelactone hydrolase